MCVDSGAVYKLTVEAIIRQFLSKSIACVCLVVALGWCRKSFHQYGVQGVECSNHSVPTKKTLKIQSLNGDWIFYAWVFLVSLFVLPFWLPIEIGFTS